MSKDDMIGKLALWSFIGGAALAVVVGLIYALLDQNILSNWNGAIAWILCILGAIVGILAFLGKGTITKKEVPAFLLASIALLLMYASFGNVGLSLIISDLLAKLLYGVSLALAMFIAPAVGLLSIKAIWEIGKDV